MLGVTLCLEKADHKAYNHALVSVLSEPIFMQQRAQQTKQQTQPALPAYTISIGIALQKDDGHAEALIHAADRALYQAKKKGRNRVCVEGQKEFDPVLSDDAKYLQAAYNPL